MQWKIIKETPRKFADESYYLKAERGCSEGTIVLEICWVQIMYALTVELFNGEEAPDLIYDCMVYREDRIEKYGQQIMRITDVSPVSKFKRLDSMQQDGVLNHVLCEKYNVAFKSTLPAKENV
ncbi:hypothetical protein A7985_07375 [Pseudoalteromonas luteoviolacea]|uniref:Uncharacterized protein n=1 Tax=Pseudoalteromonas luteoviolacea TaxID=43657 RepID=A0A1C0TWP3_9GAMM|nr:hypothetical protein [Pseudoalteromonas luteoviolacea]OCQ23752.1 hypothetical protein A7985_07375 [Pseudoalteromonas luteoviolacea]